MFQNSQFVLQESQELKIDPPEPQGSIHFQCVAQPDGSSANMLQINENNIIEQIIRALSKKDDQIKSKLRHIRQLDQSTVTNRFSTRIASQKPLETIQTTQIQQQPQQCADQVIGCKQAGKWAGLFGRSVKQE